MVYVPTIKYYFAFKKEGSSTIYDIDKAWEYYVIWIKPVTEGQTLHDST